MLRLRRTIAAESPILCCWIEQPTWGVPSSCNMRICGPRRGHAKRQQFRFREFSTSTTFLPGPLRSLRRVTSRAIRAATAQCATSARCACLRPSLSTGSWAGRAGARDGWMLRSAERRHGTPHAAVQPLFHAGLRRPRLWPPSLSVTKRVTCNVASGHDGLASETRSSAPTFLTCRGRGRRAKSDTSRRKHLQLSVLWYGCLATTEPRSLQPVGARKE
jgi:hypothetical protein